MFQYHQHFLTHGQLDFSNMAKIKLVLIAQERFKLLELFK